MNAKDRIAELSNWIKASSEDRKSPLGDKIECGPYAVLVPLALDAAPGSAFDASALPVWIPEAQAPASLPTIQTGAPANQDRITERAAHLLWCLEQGRLPAMAVVGLESPSDTLQAAIDRDGLSGLDLDSVPLLGLAMWALNDCSVMVFT